MTKCDITSTGGGCNILCEAFHEGDCPEPQGTLDGMHKQTARELIKNYELLTIYPGVFDSWLVESNDEIEERIMAQIKKELQQDDRQKRKRI